MIPSKFQDVNIRIFTRNAHKMQAVQKAFRRYLNQITKTDFDPTIAVPDEYQELISSQKGRRSEDSFSNVSSQ